MPRNWNRTYSPNLNVCQCRWKTHAFAVRTHALHCELCVRACRSVYIIPSSRRSPPRSQFETILKTCGKRHYFRDGRRRRTAGSVDTEHTMCCQRWRVRFTGKMYLFQGSQICNYMCFDQLSTLFVDVFLLRVFGTSAIYVFFFFLFLYRCLLLETDKKETWVLFCAPWFNGCVFHFLGRENSSWNFKTSSTTPTMLAYLKLKSASLFCMGRERRNVASSSSPTHVNVPRRRNHQRVHFEW